MRTNFGMATPEILSTPSPYPGKGLPPGSTVRAAVFSLCHRPRPGRRHRVPAAIAVPEVESRIERFLALAGVPVMTRPIG